MKTKNAVLNTVIKGFIPFKKEIKREVTVEDVERLLKIPIRRISLYDINKAKDEMRILNEQLKLVRSRLKNLTAYAIEFIDGILDDYGSNYKRQTKIVSFQMVDVREVAARNFSMAYDNATGFLGHEVKTGKVLFPVSDLDRILIIRKSGVYSVMDAPSRIFVDKGMLYCGLAEKDVTAKTVFTILYKNKKTGFAHIKRCKIEKYILEKSYQIIPEGCVIMKMTTREDIDVVLNYKPKPRLKVLEETIPVKDFLIKGVKAAGVRCSAKEIASGKFVKAQKGKELF